MSGDPSIDPELDAARREAERLDGRDAESLRVELLTLREHYRESERRHARTLEREREARRELDGAHAAVDTLISMVGELASEIDLAMYYGRALLTERAHDEREIEIAHERADAATARRDEIAAELAMVRPELATLRELAAGRATCATCGGAPSVTAREPRTKRKARAR